MVDSVLPPKLKFLMSISMLLPLFLVAACQTTSGDNSEGRTLVGKSVSEVFSSGGNQVPLLDGQWTIVGFGKVKEENIVRYDLTSLSKIKDNVVSQLILVRNANPIHRPMFSPYTQCESKLYVFAAMISNQHRGRQDCWRTQPFFLGETGRDQPHIQQFQEDAKAKGIVIPPVMIGFGYHMADGPDAMDILYLWNPDLVLPNPDPSRTWEAEDWSVDQIFNSPEKQAVFTTFRDFAAEWHLKVWDGFENKLTINNATS